jgi:hypothetical protein
MPPESWRSKEINSINSSGVAKAECCAGDRQPQQKMPLLDHLVGAAGQGQWHGDAERLCGFEIDD